MSDFSQMGELSHLPNVGKVLESHLQQIGIQTPAQLRKLGAKETFIRIRSQVDPGACLHMLYGIQGAIEEIPDRLLPAQTKQKLKEFYSKP